MKRQTDYLLVTLFVSGLLILTGCKKLDPPTVSTGAVSDVTLTTAKAGGNILDDGGADVTARGVVWGTQTEPTTSGDMTSDGTGSGEFTSQLSGLEEGTTYYLRAYATNSEGTAYGDEVTFATASTSTASITTTAVTAVTFTSAVTGGNITSDGLAPVTARGVAYGTAANPTVAGSKTTDGSGAGTFTSNLTNLAEGTTYYVRAYATNSRGTAYGNEVTFSTTAASTATLTTAALTNLSLTGVTTGGNITGDGGAAVTARGVAYGTAASPTVTGTKTTNGSGTGAYVSSITGLSPGTVYHLRAYATNSKGTVYGNELTFVTPIADIEGNVYKTVLIGTQVWMAENLKSTRFNNNTVIPQVTDSVQWMALTTPAYTWYRNKDANKTNGALYTWFTVAAGNLCPQGWHVPTNAEYQTMEVAVGVPADSVNNWGWRGNGAGTKLKDAVAWGTGHGTNTTGFTAMPSGYRAWANGEFRGLGEIAYYWTASDDAVNGHADVGWYRRLDATSPWIYKATTGKTGGKSVWCIKN
jgi:uncharacterized protein (TIGR02145 family)